MIGHRILRSFRLRLALITLASVLTVMIAYAWAIYLHWEEEMIQRQQGRMEAVVARLPPRILSPEWERDESPRWARLRELHRGPMLGARWSESAGWVEIAGEWPAELVSTLQGEALLKRVRQWPVVQARSPHVSQRRERPTAFGRGPHPPESPHLSPFGFAGRQTDLVRFEVYSINESYWLVGGLHLENGVFWLAENIDQERAALRDLVHTHFRLGPILLVMVLVLSWVLAARALRPVHDLSAAMGRISERNLNERIAVPHAASEFVDLVDVFNRMLSRLERSFQQASRFSADASHELRTPLTVLHGELEAAVQQAPAGSPQQRQFSSLLEEVQRLRMMTDRLLQLAHADAGRLLQRSEPVDLKAVVAGALDSLADFATELSIESALQPVTIEGDGNLLRQAVMNLLTNAHKYNDASSGWIRVTLTADATSAVLCVSNSGTPISAQSRSRIFERFYRGDRAHNRAVDGLGLGLSLAREIARAHGGELSLLTSSEEETTFCLTLPCFNPSAA